MSTLPYPAAAVPDRRPLPASAPARHLFLGTAVTLAAVAFLGFAPSYWAPLAAGTLALSPAVHVHGLLFFLWMLFFVTQTALVAAGRKAWHRELGLFGIALAALMVFSGVLVTIDGLERGLSGLQPNAARAVAAIALSAMMMFAIFVALGIANIRRPEIHRRLMVLATFSIIGAAVVRLMRLVPGMGHADRAMLAERVLLGTALVDLLLVAVVLLDRRATGRWHPVWLTGGAFFVAIQWSRPFVARTEPWANFTNWLASLGS